MFDKMYLIKSISAVTNYNSSSCFWTLPLDEIVILMIVFLLWISVVSLFIHRLVQNAYCTDKLNSKFSGGEKFATYNQDFSILNIPKETMTWKTGTLKISSLKLDRYLIIHNQGSRYKRRKKLTLFGRLNSWPMK